MKRSYAWIFGVMVALLAGLAGAGTAAQEVEPDPLFADGFEAIEGALPEHWADASEGELAAELALDPKRGREGEASLRLRVRGWQSGVARARRTGIRLPGGSPLTLEVWLRADSIAGPVALSLRSVEPPGAPLLSGGFGVGRDWRRCVVKGTSPASEAEAVLEIGFTGPGALWIDGVRLVPGEIFPIEPRRPEAPRKGNRIFNSSFEVGTDGWAEPERWALVSDIAPDGRAFARLGPGATLEARPFEARPERTYTLSAWLRGRGLAKAELSLAEPGGGFRAEQAVDVGPEWRRLSFSTPLPCMRGLLYVAGIRAEGEGALDVDAVQVEEGPMTDFRPAAPFEAAAPDARRYRSPALLEKLSMTVRVYAQERTPPDAAVRYRLEGFYGETVAAGREKVEPDVSFAEVPLSLRVPVAGALKLVVEGAVGSRVVSRTETLLRVGGDAAAAAGDPEARGTWSFYAWSGTEEHARAETRQLVRSWVRGRGKGSGAIPAPPAGAGPARPYTALAAAGPWEADGSPRPVVAAAAAFRGLFSDAEAAASLEREKLTAYLFRRGSDTVAALWSERGVTEALDFELPLPGRSIRSRDLMGNARGPRAAKESAAFTIRQEPLYVVFLGTPPEKALAAVKAALAKAEAPPAPPPPAPPGNDAPPAQGGRPGG